MTLYTIYAKAEPVSP